MKHLFLALVILGSLQSCKQNTKVEAANEKSIIIDSSSLLDKNPYKDLVFDDKKDLVCGMPTSAGVSDTLHYKDKVYGFCSKECKDEFVKNPAAYLAAK
jgi:YHS domain-containing protein